MVCLTSNCVQVTALHKQYRAWAQEEGIAAIIIKGNGGKVTSAVCQKALRCRI